jgi:hypothetical protein
LPRPIGSALSRHMHAANARGSDEV